MEDEVEELWSRHHLAGRWKTSIRTIDRKRAFGILPWIDLSGGRGRRPIVRFDPDVVRQYESKMTKRTEPK